MAFMRAEISETLEYFMICCSMDGAFFCDDNNICLPVGTYERDDDLPDDAIADQVAYTFEKYPEIDNFEIVYKFYGQLSAPGYMDKTEYVLGDSRADVAQQLLDMYFDEDDECMDEDEKEDREWLEDTVRRDEDDFRRSLKTLGEFIEGKDDN